MERLTEWTGERWIATAKRVNGKLAGDKVIYALCAAYEDTGLTPEEIAVLRQQLAGKVKKMSCKFKDECPSYSGWCETPIEDFSRCIPFIINAVKTAQNETAALRQQLSEKEKEYAGLRTRCNHLVVKSSELEYKLACAIAERDAAIADLSHDCSICRRDKNGPECADCRGNDDAWNTYVDHWIWRGQQKEDTENDNI